MNLSCLNKGYDDDDNDDDDVDDDDDDDGDDDDGDDGDDFFKYLLLKFKTYTQKRKTCIQTREKNK